MSDTQAQQQVEELVSSAGFDSRLSELVLTRSWIKEGKLENRGRWLYWLLMPLLILVALYCAIKYFGYLIFVRPKDKIRRLLGPQRGLSIFDGAHWLLEKTRNGVTSWRALAAIYSAPLALHGMKGWRSRLARFWFAQPEAQAVRNRLRMVYEGVYHHLLRLKWRGVRECNVLSLACGSAQAMIEAAARFQAENPSVKLNITLVDLDEESLSMAENLAAAKGVSVFAVRAKVKDVLAAQPAGKWHLVEEAGFLDYRPDGSFGANCSDCYRILAPGGLFLAAQIGHSPWWFMTRWITGWPLLIRRSRRKFRRLLEASEIPPDAIEIASEPHEIYHISFVSRAG